MNELCSSGSAPYSILISNLLALDWSATSTPNLRFKAKFKADMLQTHRHAVLPTQFHREANNMP